MDWPLPAGVKLCLRRRSSSSLLYCFWVIVGGSTRWIDSLWDPIYRSVYILTHFHSHGTLRTIERTRSQIQILNSAENGGSQPSWGSSCTGRVIRVELLVHSWGVFKTWGPPLGGLLGTSFCEETPGQTQNLLEIIYLHSGLAIHWDLPDWAEEGCLVSLLNYFNLTFYKQIQLLIKLKKWFIVGKMWDLEKWKDDYYHNHSLDFWFTYALQRKALATMSHSYKNYHSNGKRGIKSEVND